jgi:outer membrane biosynthesis protein TonB
MNIHPVPVGRPVALRTALIWRDEVMSDFVADVPRKITVGHKGRPTFVVPDVGLPAGFAIFSPGNRGYLLTLGQRMRGTICLDGREQDVQDFVARGEGAAGPGGFRATPIGGRDWGVIDLDESGDYKLFFQFVPVEYALPSHADTFVTLTKACAAAVYFMIAMVVGMVVWRYVNDLSVTEWIAWMDDQVWGEWTWRGALLVVMGLILFSMGWSLAMADPEQQASTGFSIILHGTLLIWTIVVYSAAEDPNVWPGPRALTGTYVVTRLEPELKQEKTPTIGKVNKEEAAAKSETKPAKTATKNDEGASGGKGEQERARDPNAKDVPPEAPKVAMLEDKNRRYLDNIIDRNLSTSLGKFTGIKGDTLRAGSIGFGPGGGTGVGEGTGTGTTKGSKGKGSGGGGNVDNDFVSHKGPVDTGKERPGGKCVGANCAGSGPKEVKVSVGSMSGDPGGYTEEEINRVVRAAAGRFRACYQKELNRSPGIGGKIVVKFKIGPDGGVKSSSPTGASTLTNEAVQSCVSRNVNTLRFPPKGAIANVTYPFLFSPGG